MVVQGVVEVEGLDPACQARQVLEASLWRTEMGGGDTASNSSVKMIFLLCSRVCVGALHLGDLDVEEAVEGHVVKDEAQGGVVPTVGANVHVHFQGIWRVVDCDWREKCC